jgi:hypothetical protein
MRSYQQYQSSHEPSENVSAISVAQRGQRVVKPMKRPSPCTMRHQEDHTTRSGWRLTMQAGRRALQRVTKVTMVQVHLQVEHCFPTLVGTLLFGSKQVCVLEQPLWLIAEPGTGRGLAIT